MFEHVIWTYLCETPVRLQCEQPRTCTWERPGLSNIRATNISSGLSDAPQTGQCRGRSESFARQYGQPIMCMSRSFPFIEG